MIKLAFMVDKAFVLGATSEEDNKKRFELLPKGLEEQMDDITKGDHYAAGRKSMWFYQNGSYDEGTILYILTRNKYLVLNGSANMEVVSDINYLIDKYKNSDETLVVIGGKEIFMAFLQHAKEVCVAITNDLVPGDIVFDEWNTDDLELTKKVEWDGGITYHYIKSI